MNNMFGSLYRVLQKAIEKYRAKGFISLLYSSKWYIHYMFSKKIRKSRIFRGKRQFAIYTNLRYQIQKLWYDAPADPWEPVWVDPCEVESYVKVNKEWGLGRILNWNFNYDARPFFDKWRAKGLKEHFSKNKKWKNTIYWAQYETKFEDGTPVGNYSSFEQFIDIRTDHLDELYEDIKNNGYRPNFEAGHDVPDEDIHRDIWHELEPLVVIGKDGSIFFVDGWHRFTIAKLLNLNSVPVNVLARHSEWQNLRDTISRANRTDDLDLEVHQYIDHPDLEDVIDE